MIFVAIADDHPEMQLALRLLLDTLANVELVFTSTNSAKIIPCLLHHQPDILIMAIDVPRFDGLQLTEQIAALPIPTRVILIANFGGRAVLQEAMAAGAQGFLLKSDLVKSLPEALDAVYQDGQYFPGL